MAGHWSEAVQKTHLAEGLATGAIVLGVEGITSEQLPVSLAFEQAWPTWKHNIKFPQVHASSSRNDIGSVLDRSQDRRWSTTAYWTGLPAQYLQPVLRDKDTSPHDALESVANRTDIPVEDWLALARRFVDEIASWDENAVLRG